MRDIIKYIFSECLLVCVLTYKCLFLSVYLKVADCNLKPSVWLIPAGRE